MSLLCQIKRISERRAHKKSALPEARRSDPRQSRGSDSNSHPQGNVISRCKQVSRLGLIRPARLPAFAVASDVPSVRFTVTGIARNFHPIPVTHPRRMRRASLRRYTGYSFVILYYRCCFRSRQSGGSACSPIAVLSSAPGSCIIRMKERPEVTNEHL